MNIQRYNNHVHSGIQQKKVNQAKSSFSISTEQSKDTSFEDPLLYYRKLCAEFPNISFRLDDRAEGRTQEVFLGYGGSMNQIGNNFGELFKCSIELDVSVIRKMQADPQYAQRVKQLIQRTESQTSQRAKDATAAGMTHTAVSLYEENGELSESIGMSRYAYSTEEEVKRMWNMDAKQSSLINHFSIMRDTMIDSYLEITEQRKPQNSSISAAIKGSGIPYILKNQ